MYNQKTWTVYDCGLVDMAETHQEAEGLRERAGELMERAVDYAARPRRDLRPDV